MIRVPYPRPLHLLFAGVILWSGATLAADPPPPGVIVAPVRLVEFSDRIEALGTLAANESVDLTATVTETISVIHFDDGDRVEKDQVLVAMTSQEEHAQLEEASATVNEASRQYQRIKPLASEGTAAKSLLDERQREWHTARARLAAIESRLADRLIKAPFDGIVGLRDVSVGALVQPGDLITTLDDDRVMKLEFPVSATYLDVLHPGLEVITTSRAFSGRTFTGTVNAVDSRIDPVTRSIRVRALLPNPDYLLRPGMLMHVELLKNPRKALVIPEESLQPLGEQQFVFVVTADNTVEQRELRIGGRRPGLVEVVEGLAAGEQVVTHGHMKIRPGAAVTITAIDDGSLPLSGLLRSLPGGSRPE
ncbi:MAG: efflux RND transporter periplasmic adaptor subunit [Gammaproteobacteria bacterium]|nr:efflux RND transporter periplasmic adaptor subunit [Gammaproteobacteria bacterium]